MRRLNLCHYYSASNPIEDISIELFHKEENNFFPLKKLLMSNNCLTSKSIFESSNSIFQSSFLKTLSFGNNNIQDIGVKELFKRLYDSKSIAILFLGMIEQNQIILRIQVQNTVLVFYNKIIKLKN